MDFLTKSFVPKKTENIENFQVQESNKAPYSWESEVMKASANIQSITLAEEYVKENNLDYFILRFLECVERMKGGYTNLEMPILNLIYILKYQNASNIEKIDIQ